MNKNRVEVLRKKIHKIIAFSVFLTLGLMVSTVGAILLQNLWFSDSSNAPKEYSCESLNSSENINFTETKIHNIEQPETPCFRFYASPDSKLSVNTTHELLLIYPDNSQLTIRGEKLQNLSQDGEYKVIVEYRNDSLNHQLNLELTEVTISERSTDTTESESIDPSSRFQPYPLSGGQRTPTYENHDEDFSSDSFTRHSNPSSQSLVYNVRNVPPFNSDRQIQAIVDEMVDMVRRRGLSSESLSISLIDLTAHSCCAYGGYQDNVKRFPASITKLFWIVAYYAKIQQGLTSQEISNSELYKMINDSDNEVASDVVDSITQTSSRQIPGQQGFQFWLDRRYWINSFFESAGYPDINVSQKNFPIPKYGLMEPKGFDLQMRNQGLTTVRNYLRTHDVARLLYEIEMDLAVSPFHSKQIKRFMEQDLDPNYWRNIQYNSIEGFFPELLPQNSQVFSKVGWYSGSRQDAAIIYSPDRRTRYILVVFGEDSNYAQDWRIFSDLSKLVYDRMTALN